MVFNVKGEIKMANQVKDPAEAYREERKKRLEKAAKSAAKKKNGNPRAKQLAGKIIGIIVSVVVICAMLFAVLEFFGTPEKLLTSFKVEQERITIAEYSYYYTTIFRNYVNQSYSYDNQYGSGYGKMFTGYDYSQLPANQTTQDKDGNTVTFSEFFSEQVISNVEQIHYYAKLAKLAGTEISSERQDSIDEAMDSFKSEAENNNFSTSRYIALQYGKGLNAKKVRNILTQQYLVEQYLEDYSKNLENDVSDAEIESVYEEKKDELDVVDIRLFGFKLDTAAEEETSADGSTPVKNETLELANAMLEEVTDEESFKAAAVKYAAEADKETYSEDSSTILRGVSKSTVNSNISEDAAEWLFDSNRKAGDKKLVETDSYIFVVMMVQPRYRDETNRVNVRHILISFEGEEKNIEEYDQLVADGKIAGDQIVEEVSTEPAEAPEEVTDINGETVEEPVTEFVLTDEIKAMKYATAEKILAVFNAGEKQESDFATLADKYSDDTASTSSGSSSTGSGTTGGLYKSVAKGQYVQPFEEWCYDPARQDGDVEIIETTYGYHIMYFVNTNDAPDWKMTCRSTVAEARGTAEQEEDASEYAGTAKKGIFFDWGYKKSAKFVESYAKQIISNLQAQSS